MDVLVLPSLHEGLPYVIVEAQSTGLKCLVSDKVTKEVNATGDVTFLSLTEDALNWRDEIIRTFENRICNRADYGVFMAGTCFNISTQARKLEDILNCRN